MHVKMKSLYPFGGAYVPTDIFGYVSHGVPGIEIVGVGKHARQMKEKFIYLSRVHQLKFPLRRIVLCVEGEIEGKKFKNEEYRYLELPLLVMLWTLTENLPLKNLDDCFASGKISIEGLVENLNLSDRDQENLLEYLTLDEDFELKIIAPENIKIAENYYHLPFEGLMGHLRLSAV